MRVIMFPAVGVPDENRYIDILVKALRASGIEVHAWHKHLSFQYGDIFHIHWPEIIPEIRTRKYNGLRGLWITYQFFSTIRRIKQRGGRIVWTVHDLVPHDVRLSRNVFFKKFMDRFIAEVDIILSLTVAGIKEIMDAMPTLKNKAFAVAHHPHYRELFHPQTETETCILRRRFAINENQKVFSFLGSMRANKRPDLVASAFNGLSPTKNFLVMAGLASTQTRETIEMLLENAENKQLDFRRIPEGDMLKLYSITDILVFPGNDYFNSGTIYTSLSLNTPVIAAWSPTNAEIQEMVGNHWLYLYREQLSTSVLEKASDQLIDKKVDQFCDLSIISPTICAREHIAAYTMSLTTKHIHNQC